MNTKLFAIIVAGIGIITLMSGSCEKKEIACDGNHPDLTYQKDIKPIIDANCVDCHEGYANFTGLNVSISNGAFEREVITRQTMPQGSKLKMEELILIKCWLDNGAKEK